MTGGSVRGTYSVSIHYPRLARWAEGATGVHIIHMHFKGVKLIEGQEGEKGGGRRVGFGICTYLCRPVLR